MDWTITPGMLDAVIALTAAEGVLLWLYRRWTGKGPSASDFVWNLASGMLLMLALRSQVSGGAAGWTAAALAAAGMVHAADQWLRFRRAKLRPS